MELLGSRILARVPAPILLNAFRTTGETGIVQSPLLNVGPMPVCLKLGLPLALVSPAQVVTALASVPLPTLAPNLSVPVLMVVMTELVVTRFGSCPLVVSIGLLNII